MTRERAERERFKRGSGDRDLLFQGADGERGARDVVFQGMEGE